MLINKCKCGSCLVYTKLKQRNDHSVCFMYTLIWVAYFKSVLSSADPPGGIDNSKIAVNKCGHITLKQGKQSF